VPFAGHNYWIPSLLQMSLFHARYALRDLARPQLMSEPISPSVYFLLDRANFFMDDPLPFEPLVN